LRTNTTRSSGLSVSQQDKHPIDFLAANRELLARRFADAGLADVYQPAEATYLAWLDLRLLETDDPSALLLTETGVATTPGPDHGHAGAGFARLNFATQPDVLDEAVTRIIELIGTHR
jgi:cystathionine beta-lyase